MRRKLFFSIAVVCATLVATAQPPSPERSDLEKERAAIAKELADIQNTYKDVKSKGKQALGQLNAINRKISLQEKYISSISKELRIIDDELYLSNLEIYRLQKQVDTLKAEYARTIVYAYKNRSSYDHLNFIFSASSFNDAVKRIEYLKSYRKYRQNQVETILQTQDLIAKRQQQQLARKDQKNVALQSQTKERQVLDVQKKEKGAVLNEIKSQEKDLQKQIAAKKKRDADLKKAVLAIVRREQEKLKEIARLKAEEDKKKNIPPVTTKPVTPTTNPTTSNTDVAKNNKTTTPPATKKPEYSIYSEKDIKLGADFNSSRGRLPWPVDKGYVSIHFGRYKIEGTLIEGDNPGITIATDAGSSVKSVFDGEVVGVYNLGDGMTVTVRHGKYFTTYSNLMSANVKKGDQLKTGQTVGRAGRNDDGDGGQIDFILMIDTNNVNPEPWLRR
jgi:septal ring factor EnvC (AmiA/AmiB activator)